MSTIAWDGATLAADRQATRGSLKTECQKIFRSASGKELVGYVGTQAAGQAIVAWFNAGADPERFPPSCQDYDRCCGFFVLREDGSAVLYENTPHPSPILERFWAFGSGRDFALGAMAANETAYAAVSIACRFDESSGMGIDVLGFGEE